MDLHFVFHFVPSAGLKGLGIAISFNSFWFLMHAYSLSQVQLSVTPWFLRPWDFPGKNSGVGCLFPPPGDLSDPGIEPASLALQVDSLPAAPSLWFSIIVSWFC